MKQEEKWPVFQTSPKMPAKFAKENNRPLDGGVRRESQEMFEEMSGMVTLKRKGKEQPNGLPHRPGSPFNTMF